MTSRLTRTAPVALVVALLAGLLACGEKAKPRDTGQPVLLQDNIRRIDSSAKVDTACRAVGDWSDCNLEKRLESAGLAPRRQQGAIRQPFLSVPGIVFALGAGELQSYLYSDTALLQRDLSKLDTVRVAPSTAQINWRKTPTLIHSNNLLAILLSDDETQVERVRNAITAGLPSATGSRSSLDSGAADSSAVVRDGATARDTTRSPR